MKGTKRSTSKSGATGRVRAIRRTKSAQVFCLQQRCMLVEYLSTDESRESKKYVVTATTTISKVIQLLVF